MIIKPQERYVAVNAKGEICGPCMHTKEDTEYALTVGLERTIRDLPEATNIKSEWTWKSLGYKVIRCLVTPLEEV